MVQETTFLNANDQYDPGRALPYPAIWEIQGYGAVVADRVRERVRPPAGNGDSAGGGAGDRVLLSRWFDVRLTFADGTRLEVLAVVTEGRLTIEELRAEPPLPLPGMTVLAQRIRRPLEDACRAAALRAPRTRGPEEAPAGPVPAEPPPVESLPLPLLPDGPPAAPAPGSAPEPPPATDTGDSTCEGEGEGDADRHRVRSTTARGRAARRAAAQAYRAAQDRGADPVLAVMSATGRSRRGSLRLIAAARVDGLLSPRRHRR
ncbi:DUF6214 family protein [Streptomyces yaizuensis]|uniref:DUF6214 family protein n=1 Tax=Streptomyces yaizuensis TaxID=2989713 RepID=A0ABQ5NYB4_9ACTN|nr:DUF6214 family protein [Streptomyces sp. YSPA8]GLF95353.1 DUF6214 family protein [Streptomyces sp. YSPA8]